MIEQQIKGLFEDLKLGGIVKPIEAVSGGFMHRMYKVCTADRIYAVKQLNPEIMKRPEAAANYAKAEHLESIIEKAGIPIIPALSFDGRKMIKAGTESFYLFEWHNGSISDWNNITEEQCRKAADILGRIHALEPDKDIKEEHEECHIDWDRYIREAQDTDNEVYRLIGDNEELLRYAETELNRARRLLPDIVRISDEDMDPKNVMWDNGKPYVIDLECLDYGNPVSHVLQLSLQWSGITICNIELNHIKAFFEGYFQAYYNGFRSYAEIFGLVYTWLEWLEYNISRALGKSTDEKEREMGISEVKNTLKRIRYIYDNETEIKKVLEQV